jgi:hypothetical protein
MAKDEEVKAKVINILNAARPKKPRQPRKSTSVSISQTAVGDGAVQVGGNLHINTRQVIRAEVTPGAEHITDAQAAALHEKIQELTDLRNLVKRRPVTKAHYWSRLNRHCHVPRYRLIKLEDFDKAMRWCRQQLAILSGTKTAQKRDPAWRPRKIAFIHLVLHNSPALEPRYRNYLLNNFKKRSTAELTDDELRRACIWLAAQKRQEGVKP